MEPQEKGPEQEVRTKTSKQTKGVFGTSSSSKTYYPKHIRGQRET